MTLKLKVDNPYRQLSLLTEPKRTTIFNFIFCKSAQVFLHSSGCLYLLTGDQTVNICISRLAAARFFLGFRVSDGPGDTLYSHENWFEIWDLP